MKLKQIALLLLLIALICVYVFINPSKVDFLPKCPLYFTTGLYCPGCGSQRATHQLLNFNLLGVLNQNILYVLGILLFMYNGLIIILNKYFNKSIYNYMYHPKTPIIILVLVIAFWVLRNLPYYPFNLLAPK